LAPTNPFFIFGFPLAGPHWAFSHCHVEATHWPTSSTCTAILPRHLPATQACHVLYGFHVYATSYTVYHVDVHTTMWHFLIGPHVDLKMSKMSDTWQYLVLPHHHVDVIMTCVTLCVCHIHCTDVDIIRTDADVSSTDVDSALLTGLG
jgi:hypothetical protein